LCEKFWVSEMSIFGKRENGNRAGIETGIEKDNNYNKITI